MRWTRARFTKGNGGSSNNGTAWLCGERTWIKCNLRGVSEPGMDIAVRNWGVLFRVASWSRHEYFSSQKSTSGSTCGLGSHQSADLGSFPSCGSRVNSSFCFVNSRYLLETCSQESADWLYTNIHEGLESTDSDLVRSDLVPGTSAYGVYSRSHRVAHFTCTCPLR